MNATLDALPTYIGTKKVKFATPDGRLYYDVVPCDADFVLLRKTIMNTNTYWVRIQFTSDAIQAELQIGKLEGEVSMSMLVECE